MLAYNKIEMGVRQSLEAEGEEIRECEWEAAGDKERSFGRWRTLRNRRTGAMVDEYQLSWAGQQEYRFYLKSFNWRHRRRNLAPVVTSVSFRPVCTGEGCSGRYAANVYLEHVALRLSQIEDVPLADALFILGEALQGYLQLYQHSGYFQVQPEQVCFDRAGRVKVWVNADLSCNYPDTDVNCNQKDEVDMVEQLIHIVNEATDPEQMPSPNLEQYFDLVRRRQEVQIGFEYAKLVAMEFARLHQIKASNRFDAVIDIFSNAHPDLLKHYNPSTLPSSQAFLHQAPQQLPPPMQRLNTCQSLPNFHPNSFSTMSYQPPQSIHYAPVLARPESSPYLQQYNPQDRPQLPVIPRLQEINMSQFGEASVQTKRKSRNSKTSKNSKSQMVGHEQTTQNQSVHFNQSHADDRNTMKSMPLRNPYATHRDRFANSQFIRYSECNQDLFSQKQYEYPHSRPFNHHDAFGLTSPQHRRMNDSESSYRLPSSNSSQSKQRYSKHSNHSSSRRQSIRNDPMRNEHNEGYFHNERNDWNMRQERYESSSKRGSSRRGSRRERNERLMPVQVSQHVRYYINMGEELQLDPEIEADIKKYLG